MVRKRRIIPVLIILIAAGLVYSQQDAILDMLGLERVSDIQNDDMAVDEYVVGTEVRLSGTLFASESVILYPAVLEDADGQRFGVKSTITDMSTYVGSMVTIRGRIIDIINTIPVVSVVTVLVDEEEGSDTVMTGATDVVYISGAGMIIDPENMGDFVMIASDTSRVTFSHSEGDELVVRYFACTDGDSSNTDCGFFVDQFDYVTNRFVGNSGDEWLQLPETNTRFGTNDNRIGYRVLDADREMVIDVLQGIVFVNDQVIENRYLTDARNACRTIENSLLTVEEYEVDYDDELLRIRMDGSNTEDMDTSCIVDVDPTGALRPVLVSIDSDELGDDLVDNSDGPDESSDSSVDDDDTMTQAPEDVEQFPIAGRTPLPFVSSKGYTIVFPSSNIAFQGDGNDESLGIDGVSGCYLQMNVVAFANAEQVLEDPAIIMYDCSNVADEVDPGPYIRKDGSESDKIFFISVENPAWYDFANAVEVK